MVRNKTFFVCNACGAAHAKWSGRCEACGEWNTITEEKAILTPKGLTAGKGEAIEFANLSGAGEDAPRMKTGIEELDRVLGGGLVAGSAILIGGDPGIGKSTVLLQAVVALAERNVTTAYISGEESVSQIQLRASRLGLKHEKVQLATVTSVRDIIATLDQAKAPPSTLPPHVGGENINVVVIDSIQTMFLDNLDAAPGTVSQVRGSAHELVKLAKARGLALFLVGHVTKDGQIAGPRVLEHMVDTVLYFEGERGHPFRILRAVKNRFGGTDEIGVFEMTDKGLAEVANPSALFLAGREGRETSGSAVFAGIEGSRPLLVEIQALVSPSAMGTPRRAVVGWDSARLAMILAVLESRAGMRFADREVYLNVAGGLRISETGADLAAAVALLSALTDVPVPRQAVFFGEISLSGDIRPVGRTEARLKEAEKLGFKQAYGAFSDKEKSGMVLRPMQHVEDLVDMFLSSAKSSAAKVRQSAGA